MTRRALGLAVLAGLVAAAPASAATLPAGTYDVTFTGGSVQSGLLPSVPLPAQPPVTIVVPEGTPAEVAIPLSSLGTGTVTGVVTLPPCPYDAITCLAYPATAPATVEVIPTGPVVAGIEPATGAAHASGSMYGSVSSELPFVGAFTCSFGSAQSPISVALSTDPPGAPWEPVTGAIKLADPLVDLPAPDCTDPFVDLLFATVVGDGSLSLEGTALRRPDPAPPAPPAPPAAPPPPPAGPGTTATVVRIPSRRLRFNRRGRGTLRVTCVSAPVRCTGTVALTARSRVRGRTRTVRLARARFAIAPGRTAVTRMRLSRAGRSLLSGRRRVRAVATATATGLRRPVTRRLTATRARR